jgi:EAL domain-containing protein (putative c-di-GMP-specific phosphodiesterase class I)
MIDSTDKARNTISEFKAMGIKIAIDDFGTGY